MLTQAGLKLLNEVGLEKLTLRLLGRSLGIQAGTLYWHFKSKEELLDEMATSALSQLVLPRESSDWDRCAGSFGFGLRRTLLTYRDGARMVSGTRLTNTEYMKTVERIAATIVESGFTVREATVLLSTIYNYTLSFVMEEQAVYPRPGERSPAYDIAKRNARLDPKDFPLLRRSGAILFDNFDRRYREGLNLILRGAQHRHSTRHA